MSQKKLFADQRTETVHRFVVAGEIGQWDCPKSETKSSVGSQMDTSVSQQRKDLVSESIAQTPPDGSTGERLLRTVGYPNPSSAQKHKKSSGVLWSGGHLQRSDRSGNPSLAQHPHDSSDSPSSQACDPQASGPVSKGADPARPYGQKTKRRPSGRLHCGALPGFSTPPGGAEPQGHGHGPCLWNRGARPKGKARSGLSSKGLATPWYSEIFADGQRYEPDGRSDAPPNCGATGSVLSGLSGHCSLYPRATARLQRFGRALQWALAGEGLAALSIPHAGATPRAFSGLSKGLQYLPQTKIDPPGKRRFVPGPVALSAQEDPLDSPSAPLPGADLVYTENR